MSGSLFDDRGREVFEPRDPRWKRCLIGCRPAAGVHRFDCPNAASARPGTPLQHPVEQ